MREMKDSGIEWIGEIPTNWKVVPLKYLLSNEIDSLRVGPFGSTLKGTDFTNEGYWVYNQRTVLDCNFDANDTFISEEKYHTMTGFQIRYNDILITTRGTIGKICRIPKKYYKGIIHPCIIKFRINEDKVLYPYLELIFNSSNLFQTQLTYKSNATTIEVIYSGTLKNLLVPIPATLTLQKQISKYLIQRCNKIDSIVNDIQHQIELLQEYKQSVITEAVTKGLDKNAAMKDSGIEWTKTKVKYCCSMISGDGITSQVIADFEDAENIYPVYGGNGQRGYYCKYNHNGEYILIGRQGALAGNVHRVNDKFWATDHAIVVTCNNKSDIGFMYYLFIMMNLNRYALDTAAQPGLAVSKVMALPCNVPNIDTQREISYYLDSKCTEIDAVLADKQKQLDTLTEYKKSLIYEYVTGKKEVPADA